MRTTADALESYPFISTKHDSHLFGVFVTILQKCPDENNKASHFEALLNRCNHAVREILDTV